MEPVIRNMIYFTTKLASLFFDETVIESPGKEIFIEIPSVKFISETNLKKNTTKKLRMFSSNLMLNDLWPIMSVILSNFCFDAKAETSLHMVMLSPMLHK